jgi:XRE family aerobic/anaerobic benzoate catabolism transcriptional regulator
MTTVQTFAAPDAKEPFLVALGDTIRTLRARRGMTRRMLAGDAGVSERHLANLESGVGNASILVLRQVALALDCPLTELVAAQADASPEASLLRELLHDRSEADLQRARAALSQLFKSRSSASARRMRIALVGLRGAGKSTLGRMLAADLRFSFVELTREIERIAGCGVGEIHSLYGLAAYRRYERRALEDVVQRARKVVLATPGGLVSDAASFTRLLDSCFTVWLRASPDEHMGRVMAQGDYRPMAGSREAMDDLKRILAGRAAFYAKADLTVDTSGKSIGESFAELRGALHAAMAAGRLAAD